MKEKEKEGEQDGEEGVQFRDTEGEEEGSWGRKKRGKQANQNGLSTSELKRNWDTAGHTRARSDEGGRGLQSVGSTNWNEYEAEHWRPLYV